MGHQDKEVAARLPVRGAEVFAALIVLAGSIFTGQAAFAQANTGAFEVKEVSVYIPSSPGGGYDRYGRLLARHLGKHLPGQRPVVAKNMPGAGGLVLANFMYSNAARDGSVVAIMQNERVLDPLLGVPNANYKSSEFTWLGGVNQLTNICVTWHTTSVTSALQIRDKELVVGVSSGSSTETGARLLNELAGTKLKLVRGYPGTNEIMLAMERGEVQAMCGIGWDSYQSSRAGWISKKSANVFVRMGASVDELRSVPDLKDILLDARDRPVADFLTGRLLIGRPFMSTPGLPPPITQTLRQGFWMAVQDPALIAEAAKADMPIVPISSADVQRYIEQLESTPKPVIDRARNLL